MLLYYMIDTILFSLTYNSVRYALAFNEETEDQRG